MRRLRTMLRIARENHEAMVLPILRDARKGAILRMRTALQTFAVVARSSFKYIEIASARASQALESPVPR
jgi:hypothetical protein